MFYVHCTPACERGRTFRLTSRESGDRPALPLPPYTGYAPRGSFPPWPAPSHRRTSMQWRVDLSTLALVRRQARGPRSGGRCAGFFSATIPRSTTVNGAQRMVIDRTWSVAPDAAWVTAHPSHGGTREGKEAASPGQ